MLFSKPELFQLVKNGQPDETGKDHYPVAKLFIRETGMVWLVTEINPENPAFGYGLYDTGAGCPNVGGFNLTKLQIYKIDGNSLERDPYFIGKYPLSVYAKVAQSLGYITEVDTILRKAMPPRFSP